MPLSPTKVNYVEIVSAANSASFDTHISKTSLNLYSQSPCLAALESYDTLAKTFLVDEGIMEIMSLEEPPRIDNHHYSLFLPHLAIMSTYFEESSSPFTPPTIAHDIWLKGNLGNITQMMSIDISFKLGIIEHSHIGVSCSPNEMKTYTLLF